MGKKNKRKRAAPPVETALDFRARERSAAMQTRIEEAGREGHTENAEAPDGVSGIWT